MTTPFHISDEAVEQAARLIMRCRWCIPEDRIEENWTALQHGEQRFCRDAARAVLSSPPVSELVEAMKDTLNMLRAAHMQSGIHHDGNKRVIKARAALAPFTAAEKADVS